MQTPNSCEIQYSLTYQDVVEVLRIARESQSCASLDLAIGDMKLSLTRSGATEVLAAAPVAAVTASAVPTVASVAPAAPVVAIASAADPAHHEVRAPMLGIFYRSPSPGAPAFVKEGDIVKADDTIGLIEVMKLFSTVTAGVAGRIVQIVAQDAVLVEHDQPLMRIEPAQG